MFHATSIVLALLTTYGAAAGASPLTNFGYYGKPRLETIIEPCAADYSCVVFDGQKLSLDPVSETRGDLTIVAKKDDGTIVTYLIKLDVDTKPSLALVTRAKASGKVKLFGIDRDVAASSGTYTPEQIEIIDELVKDKFLKTYLTSADPLAMATAAKAIANGDYDNGQVAVDLAVLNLNKLYTDLTFSKVMRLQRALNSNVARTCYANRFFSVTMNWGKDCGYHFMMNDSGVLYDLQAKFASVLGK